MKKKTNTIERKWSQIASFASDISKHFRGGWCFTGVGEGVGGGGGCPPLLDRANVQMFLFAHILLLKTQFFKILLARFARQL